MQLAAAADVAANAGYEYRKCKELYILHVWLTGVRSGGYG